MKIRPLGDRIVLRPDEPLKETAGGIILPDMAQEKVCHGTVIAAGPGSLQPDGSRYPSGLEEGQRVAYAKYAGNTISVEGEVYLVVNESEVLAVLE